MVDGALRTIARRRAALDAEEARWLREAEAMQLWRRFGMVSMLDYLERVLDHSSRTAQDRLRVARALGSLPRLTDALAGGAMSFSAVRELTRVATPATEAAWLGAATGKNLRQIELLVADHRPGDDPSDPPSPEARRHVVRFELSAETFATLRQARTVINDEHGTNLSDDDFVAALCHSVLDGASSGEPTGRAKFQIAVTVCERCGQGWQEGGGATIAIGADAVERAMCDAQHIGSIDEDVPGRAYQDIPPSVARLVWRRDGGRCRVPGCRSARGLELHHIVHRADGGGHDAWNLVLACGSCHRAHHSGALTIKGTASDLEVYRPGEPPAGGEHARCDDERVGRVVRPEPGQTTAASDGDGLLEAPTAAEHSGVPSFSGNDRSHEGPNELGALNAAPIRSAAGSDTANGCLDTFHEPRSSVERDREVSAPGARVRCAQTGAHVGANRLEVAARREQAKAALIGLGWKPAIAGAAVSEALSAAGPEVTLEQLIRAALRLCPRSSTTSARDR
jgi:hypothetical protein